MLKRAHERTLNEEVHRMEAAPNGFPIRAELVGSCFQEEPLKGGIELPDGLLFVDPRIALKALQRRVEGKGESLRQAPSSRNLAGPRSGPASSARLPRRPGRW